MKAAASFIFAVVVGSVVIAATAPALAGLAGALLPLVVVVTLAAIGLRLVFFHTRRW